MSKGHLEEPSLLSTKHYTRIKFLVKGVNEKALEKIFSPVDKDVISIENNTKDHPPMHL